MRKVGRVLIKIAAIYFMIGISFGLYMSVTHVFNLATVHVHVNLLGWVSLALIGIIYRLYPPLEETVLAKLHFWLHNIGLPIMMISIALAIAGVNPVFFPIATIAGVLTLIGIFCFGFNALINIKKEA
jgi:cbb3-type cytochrome oxidase subunit 1